MFWKDLESRQRANAVGIVPAQTQACRCPPTPPPDPLDEADSQADPIYKVKTSSVSTCSCADAREELCPGDND